MSAGRAEPRVVLGAGLIAMAGHVLHNLVEFLPAILLAPETLLPVGVTILLVAWMLRRPDRPAFLATAGWALLVGGGGLTVLPLPFLPFTPEQTATHYAAHVVYALAQVPLLWVAGRALLRGDRPRSGRSGAGDVRGR